MNRSLVLCALILALIDLPLTAEGAGGVETRQILGSDFSSAAPPLTTIGGYGYGVTEDGTMIGGWGMAVLSKSVLTSPKGTGYAAGYGGVLQGWQHRWGFIVGNATTRVGFGGVDEAAGPGDDGSAAGFSMLEMAEAHLGILIFPWFDIGVTGGVVGTLTFTAADPFRIGYAPMVGIRIGWGAY